MMMKVHVGGHWNNENKLVYTAGRVQSTGGGGGEASPPNTQASPPKVFPNAI